MRQTRADGREGLRGYRRGVGWAGLPAWCMADETKEPLSARGFFVGTAAAGRIHSMIFTV